MSEGGAAVAGRLIVEVESSTSGFGRKLQEKIDAAAANVKAKVGVELDAEGLRKRLQKKVDKAAAGVTARVGVDLDTEGLRRVLQAKVDTAAAGVTAQVGADFDSRGLGAKVKAAAARVAAKVKVKADTSGVVREVAAAREEAEAAAKPGIFVSLRLRGNLVKSAIAAKIAGQRAVDDGINVPVNIGGGRGMRPGRLLRTGAMAALVSLIQPIVGVIGQAVGGLTAMVGAMAPAVGTIAALPIGISTLVTSMAGLKIATQGVGDGFQAQNMKAQALAKGMALTTAEQEKYDAAMKNLVPSQRKFIKNTIALKDEWTATRKMIAAPLFRHLAADIKPLASSLLPVLRRNLAGTSETAGRLVDRFTELAKTKDFQKDLGGVIQQNNRTLEAGGKSFLGFTKGYLSFQRAAAPFQRRFDRYLEGLGNRFAKSMDENRKDGSTERFLDKAGDRLKLTWDLTKNIGRGFRGIFAAGDTSGLRLLDDANKKMEKWAAWTQSAPGKRRLQKWFDAIEPGFRELGGLIGDTFKGIAKWAEDPKIAELISMIRTELGPALGGLIKDLSDDTSKGFLEFLSQTVEVLGKLEPMVQPLTMFTKALTGMLRGINGLADINPGVTEKVAQLAGALLLYKTLGKKLPKLLPSFLKGGKAGAGKGGLLSALGLNSLATRLRDGKSGVGRGVQKVFVVNWPPSLGGKPGKGGPGVVGAPGDGDGKGGGKRRKTGGPVITGGGRDSEGRRIVGNRRLPRSEREPRIKNKAGKLGVAALLAYALGAPIPKPVEKAAGSAAGQGAGIGAFFGATGAVAGAGVGQAAKNAKDWTQYFKSSVNVGESQKDIEKKLKASKVGDYAKDLGVNIKRLATDMSRNGSAGKYTKAVQKKLDDHSYFKANLQEELPGGRNIDTKKRDAGKSLKQISSGVARNVVSKSAGAGAFGAGAGLVAATKQLATYSKMARSLPNAVRTKVETPGAVKSLGDIRQLASRYKLTPKQVKTLIALVGAKKAQGEAEATGKKVRGLNSITGRPKVKEEGSAASRSRVAGLVSAIGAVRSKTVYITAIRKLLGPSADIFNAVNGASARGNIFPSVRAFARGGIRRDRGDIADRHQPELAGPGPTRVWRERETKGEAYIPLANDDRRPRAQALLSKTAELLGGVAYFAKGGITKKVSKAAKAANKRMSGVQSYLSSGFSSGLQGSAQAVSNAERAFIIRMAGIGKRGQAEAILRRHAAALDRVEALAKRRDALAKKLAAAQKKLEDLQAGKTNIIETLNAAATDFGSLSGIASGNGGFASPSFLIGELTRRAKDAADFRTTLASLAKKGLGKAGYEQIASLGFKDGLPVAQQLAGASKAELSKISALQETIAGAGRAIGTESAKSYYNSGIAVAQGLVKGMTSQTNVLAKSAAAMAKSIVTAMKKALKIKSPSRVTALIGRFTADGVGVGLDDRRKALSDKAKAMAAQLAADLNPSATTGSSYAAQLRGARGAGDLRRNAATGLPPLVGELTLQGNSSEERRDALDQAMFTLRKLRQGGVYAQRTA